MLTLTIAQPDEIGRRNINFMLVLVAHCVLALAFSEEV
jgi:hypothetical protein